MDDPYVDTDAWKFLETCRRDELNKIKKEAKVELTALKKEDIIQVRPTETKLHGDIDSNRYHKMKEE